MSEDLEWAKLRINSIIDELQNASKYIGGGVLNIPHYLTKRELKVLNQIKAKFPENDKIPELLTEEEIHKEYQYAPTFYIYTTVREIANALGIDLETDKKDQSSPIMAQYQSQSATQVNLQTLDNVIECINSVDIEWGKKEELVKLAKEFEEAGKTKDSGKLKNILKAVIEISPKVAGFLIEHAAELGFSALLFG